MEPKRTLAELRDRLKALRADVDETIRALDAVDETPPGHRSVLRERRGGEPS